MSRESEFVTLVGRRAELQRTLARFGLPLEAREDIVQAALVQLWESGLWRELNAPFAYLMVACRHRAISELRARNARRTTPIDSLLIEQLAPDPANSNEGAKKQLREERIARVREAVEEHVRRSRDDTFRLRYVDGLPVEAIARRKGCPIGTISARLAHSRIPRLLAQRVRAEMRALEGREE